MNKKRLIFGILWILGFTVGITLFHMFSPIKSMPALIAGIPFSIGLIVIFIRTEPVYKYEGEGRR